MVNAIWIDNLNKVLDYEDRLYRKLLEIADEKTGTVVKGDLEGLQTLVGREKKLVEELGKLKDVREQILEQIAVSVQKTPAELTLDHIISLLPPEKTQKLTRLKNSLKETVSQLTVKNELNQKLIQNALDYVDFSLNLLTQPAPQMTQYGRKGKETTGKGRRVLDVRY